MGWRDESEVEGTGFSSTVSKFSSQKPHGSQPFVVKSNDFCCSEEDRALMYINE